MEYDYECLNIYSQIEIFHVHEYDQFISKEIIL